MTDRVPENSQIHVTLPRELKDKILASCTETGQISILTRKLYRAFIKYSSVDRAGESVAKNWEDDKDGT